MRLIEKIMKNSTLKSSVNRILLAKWLFIILACFSVNGVMGAELYVGASSMAYPDLEDEKSLKIGWAEVDITPSRPVLVAGQFHARVSEGVLDPVTATVMAIESTKAGQSVKTIMISC